MEPIKKSNHKTRRICYWSHSQWISTYPFVMMPLMLWLRLFYGSWTCFIIIIIIIITSAIISSINSSNDTKPEFISAFLFLCLGPKVSNKAENKTEHWFYLILDINWFLVLCYQVHIIIIYDASSKTASLTAFDRWHLRLIWNISRSIGLLLFVFWFAHLNLLRINKWIFILIVH